MTEWYDDGDPPPSQLDHEDLGVVWSELRPGMRVRFKTPIFLRRGTIVDIDGRSMTVLFDGFVDATVLPDAKWYWVAASQGNQNENLVCIDRDWKERRFHQVYAKADEKITPAEAANIIGTTPKIVRRMIRQGIIPATLSGGRWMVTRSDALAHKR